MGLLGFFLDVLKTMLGFVFGTIVSAVITGLMVNKFVVKRIMGNKDIQDLVRLFREGKDRLEALLEEKKNGVKAAGS